MKLPPYVPRIRREADGLLVCPNCIEGRPGRPRAHATKEGDMQRVAHDSGDGQTIYHCPFCGAGQVVAGSDGTTECQFCHTFFTVQVQPEFAAFPQTINGMPVQVPGMPGDPTQPSPSPDGPAGGDEGTAFQPPDMPDAFQPPDDPQSEDKPNPFQGARTAARLTFTHPRTGEAYTRETDANYTHVSFKGGVIAWHTSPDAARRRSSEVYPVRSASATPAASGSGRKPSPQSFKTMWDHMFDHHGGRMPARMEGTDEEKLTKLRDLHDAEHGGGHSQLTHHHGAKVERAYIVAEGVAIPERSYMRRLALEHAHNRNQMLAVLRDGW